RTEYAVPGTSRGVQPGYCVLGTCLLHCQPLSPAGQGEIIGRQYSMPGPILIAGTPPVGNRTGRPVQLPKATADHHPDERHTELARRAFVVLLERVERGAARVLLFRLLIILLAEGRGLLPPTLGLRTLAAEIAGCVGDRAAGMLGRLQGVYADPPAALQARLAQLFEHLAEAGAAFRLWPFSTSSAARASCAGVPDWVLALAIDVLTRDYLDQTGPRAF